MKRAAFYTLGCKLNFAETSAIAKDFENHGFEKVDFSSEAEVYVINTCSVTENADRKCKTIVKEAHKRSKDPYVIIVGCYAQLKPQEILGIPGVSAVLGANEKFKVADLIQDFNSENSGRALRQGIEHTTDFVHAHSQEERTRLFFKVQDGCNYKCTFCTIPLARGKSRSPESDELVIRANQAIKETNSKELILTGVNIGDYGIIDGRRKETFFDLVKRFDEEVNVSRIRISSIEPNLLNEDIIEFVSKSNKFLPHFHVPLQSGSDAVLSRMRRRYKRDLYKDRVTQIKSLMPNAAIGVDVICGFKGETTEYFLDTYGFIENLPVSYLHVFPYSERPNTEAVNYDEPVSPKEKTRRSEDLRRLSDQKKRAFYESQVNRDFNVLFEEKVVDGKIFGFTENYIRVEEKYDPLMVNQIIPVKIKSIVNGPYAQIHSILDVSQFA